MKNAVSCFIPGGGGAVKLFHTKLPKTYFTLTTGLASLALIMKSGNNIENTQALEKCKEPINYSSNHYNDRLNFF